MCWMHDWTALLDCFLIVWVWFFSSLDDVTKQNVCSACLNCILDNEYIEALNKEWHSDCFRYFERKLICTVKAVHFEFQFIKPLYHLKYLILNPYSKYRCSVCDETLSDWYFEKGDILFCQMHYWAKYGQSCQQCSQVIFICGLKSKSSYLSFCCSVDNWWPCHGCWGS